MRQRHVAVAKHVPDYDFNNTYQYIIAREDVQLNWLRDAITDMGGDARRGVGTRVDQVGQGRRGSSRRLIGEDRDAAQRFVDTWRPRVEAMPNARHRSLLRVILGETLEHKRFFEQAIAGRSDLLGRRADGAGTGGGVCRSGGLKALNAHCFAIALRLEPGQPRGGAGFRGRSTVDR